MPVDRFELPEEKQELLGERIKAFNNLAQGQMKIEAWDAALAALGNVLKVEVTVIIFVAVRLQNNVKSLICF